jgi:hypothetical protein
MDQILSTEINVSGLEPTYASGKAAHVLIDYIYRQDYFIVEKECSAEF